MAKDLSVNVLLDFYGELLTEKQREALDMYYSQDMSLSEIAEEMQVSRQGARAFIKQGEAHLDEFEESLKLAARFAKISTLVDELFKMAEDKAITRKIEEIKEWL